MRIWAASQFELTRSTFYLTSVWLGLVTSTCILTFTSAPVTHLDFVAFYCAGETIANRANPYLQEPLSTCEHRVSLEGGAPYRTTIPAPLPPYALIPFAALSRLPFVIAYNVFSAISLLALLLAVRSLGA